MLYNNCRLLSLTQEHACGNFANLMEAFIEIGAPKTAIATPNAGRKIGRIDPMENPGRKYVSRMNVLKNESIMYG